jgi:hypothetical protein
MKGFVVVLRLVLLVRGVLGLVHPSFTDRQQQKVAKIGPIKAWRAEDGANPPGAFRSDVGRRDWTCSSRTAP